MVTYGVNYPFRRRIELVRLFVAIIGVISKCQVFLWDFGAIFRQKSKGNFQLSVPRRRERHTPTGKNPRRINEDRMPRGYLV